MSEHSKYCAWMTRPKYWRQSLSEKVRKLCHLFAFKLTKQYQKPNSLWSNSGLDFSAFYKQDKAFYFWLRQELKESKIKMSVRSSVRLVQVWSSSFWVAQVSLSSIWPVPYLQYRWSLVGGHEQWIIQSRPQTCARGGPCTQRRRRGTGCGRRGSRRSCSQGSRGQWRCWETGWRTPPSTAGCHPPKNSTWLLRC